MNRIIALACCAGMALASLSARAAQPPEVIHDWPEYRGPNGQFADTSGVHLTDDMSKVPLLWESQEKGIGFGKAHSGYGRDIGFGGEVGPGGIASPIVAGGAVIMAYFVPSGDVIDATAQKIVSPEVWDKHKWKAKIAADDVVIAIDAATGKTRWKKVFAGQGRNLSSGKRNIYGCTPIAYKGAVYAQGSCGAIYALDLTTGNVLWQTPNDPMYEEPRKKALAAASNAGSDPAGPTGWLMIQDDVLIAPYKTGFAIRMGGLARGLSLKDGKMLWEYPVHPNLLTYGEVGGKKCLLNTTVCLEAKTGAVVWKRSQPWSFTGTPLMAGSILITYVPHPKSQSKGKGPSNPVHGILAGFTVDEKGAKQAWTLPEDYYREVIPDAGGFRFFAQRDGLVYVANTRAETLDKGKGESVVSIVQAADGKVLATQPCPGLMFPFLWGDRLVMAGDISHRPRTVNPEYWQIYTTDPKDFKPLGDRWLATGKHQGTGGYELNVFDAFADGLMFTRVIGGIRCYDLRPATAAGR